MFDNTYETPESTSDTQMDFMSEMLYNEIVMVADAQEHELEMMGAWRQHS